MYNASNYNHLPSEYRDTAVTELDKVDWTNLYNDPRYNGEGDFVIPTVSFSSFAFVYELVLWFPRWGFTGLDWRLTLLGLQIIDRIGRSLWRGISSRTVFVGRQFLLSLAHGLSRSV